MWPIRFFDDIQLRDCEDGYVLFVKPLVFKVICVWEPVLVTERR